MITRRFDPKLLVLDAINRNHPLDLADVLERVTVHLLGIINFVPRERIVYHCNKFLRDDQKARTDPLELYLFGDNLLRVQPNGEITLIDATADQRFVPLWNALVNPKDPQE